MSQRPIVIPRFATSAAYGAIVEPSSLIRQDGLAPGTRIPAQWLNFQMHEYGRWIDYLRGHSHSNFTRITVVHADTTAGVLLTEGCTADSFAPEADKVIRRLIAIDVNNVLFVSRRGDHWRTRIQRPTSGFGSKRCVIVRSNIVLLGTEDGAAGKIWYTLPAGWTGGLSALDDDANEWTSASVPGGTGPVLALRDGGGHLIAKTNAKLMWSVDGTSWTNITESGGSHTGNWVDAVWTGQYWVATTTTNEVWRTTDAAGSWTKNVGTLGLFALAMGGDGTLLAWVGGASSLPVADWKVSTDHGATWSNKAAPQLLSINIVRWIDGAWWLGSDKAPYLAQSNDLSAWNRIPLPFDEDLGDSGNKVRALTFCEGALFAFGETCTYRSLRAEDTSAGPWAPATAPRTLHDAAYLWGRLITQSAPVNGAALTWNSVSGVLEWVVPGSGTPGVVGDARNSVRAATTASITLSGTQTIDGVALNVDDEVLVKDQATGSQNGFYVVKSGSWVRRSDAINAGDLTAGVTVPVSEGTVNGNKVFLLTTNDPITVGTTALTFEALSSGGTPPRELSAPALVPELSGAPAVLARFEIRSGDIPSGRAAKIATLCAAPGGATASFKVVNITSPGSPVDVIIETGSGVVKSRTNTAVGLLETIDIASSLTAGNYEIRAYTDDAANPADFGSFVLRVL